MLQPSNGRRGFLHRILTATGLASAAAPAALAQDRINARDFPFLPKYARAQEYKSLKQSSFDTTGGNKDYWPVAAGAMREVFNATGPGVITHIWFTIAAPGVQHLKERSAWLA